MNWFKDNYGKSILLIVSILLGISSAFLILRAMGFREVFAQIESTTSQGEKMPTLALNPLQGAKAALDAPPKWEQQEGSLFISKPYLVRDGVLINPLKPGSPPLHPPVPNEWFKTVDLDILDPGILSGDPDEDKFTNLQEWESKTNPKDKSSTPPRHLLLRLAESRQVPNRVVFTSYTDQTVTINTVDIRQPSQFLEVGQLLRGTKFKVIKFEPKSEKQSLGGDQFLENDVSEVTLEHVDNGLKYVLIKGKITDLGEGYVVLKYLLDGTDIRLKKGQEFALPPDDQTKYKYLELRDGKAVVVDVKSGTEILVPREEQTAVPAAAPAPQ